MAEDVQGPTGPAQFGHDAEQAEGDDGQAQAELDTERQGGRRGEYRDEQQAGAGAAADEVGDGAPVPLGLPVGGTRPFNSGARQGRVGQG